VGLYLVITGLDLTKPFKNSISAVCGRFSGPNRSQGKLPGDYASRDSEEAYAAAWRLESALAVMGLEAPSIKAAKREFENMPGREIQDWARAESVTRLVKLK
jgi:hypothetical protein